MNLNHLWKFHIPPLGYSNHDSLSTYYVSAHRKSPGMKQTSTRALEELLSHSGKTDWECADREACSGVERVARAPTRGEIRATVEGVEGVSWAVSWGWRDEGTARRGLAEGRRAQQREVRGRIMDLSHRAEQAPWLFLLDDLLQCSELRQHHLTYLPMFTGAAILRIFWKKARVESGRPMRELMVMQNWVEAMKAVRSDWILDKYKGRGID